MNLSRVPITTGRIDLFGRGAGHDTDAVMGREPALSVSWQNTCMSNADAILGEQVSDVLRSRRRYSSLSHELMYNWWWECATAHATEVGNE